MGIIKRALPFVGVAAILLVASVVCVVVVQGMRPQHAPEPERTLPLPSETVLPTQTQSGVETPPEPKIAPSDITSIAIPAIDVEVKASGSIMPVESERCKGAGVDTCMDPPSLDQVAWSGGFGVPAAPSEDAVLVYGHSNSYSETDQTFNNLGALVPGDQVVLMTKTGRFTYQVTEKEVVPFDEVPWRKDLYQHTSGKLVLFTCNLTGRGYDGSAVVTAEQVDAKPL